MKPVRRDIFSDFDDDGFFVFVPAIMSVGLVFSAITLIRDAFRWTGGRAHKRHITFTAHSVVDDLLDVHDGVAQRPPASLRLALIISGLATVAVTVLAAADTDFIESVDEPISDWLQDIGWIEHLGVFDPFGSTLVTVGFISLIGMSGFRCKVMATIYPASFALAWLTVEVLQHTVQRARPSGYDGLESFPSGHMVQVVFIAGLLPPALGALFNNRRLVRVSRMLLIAAVVGTGVFRIHLAKHWPLDVVAGLGIAATIVLLAHWTLQHRSWHRACGSCQWSGASTPIPWKQGIVVVRPQAARLAGLTGAAIAILCAAGLAVATLVVGIPTDPEGTGFGSAISGPVQVCLAGLMALAGVIALRWKGVAAFLMATSAVGLGVFAAIEYVPPIAFGLTAALLVPGVLTWLSWQPQTTIGRIAALAVITATALVATGLSVREVHAYYYGPTHPESVAAELDSDADWLWLGGVTDSAATVHAGGLTPGTTAQLHLSWAATGDRQILEAPVEASGIAEFQLDDLTAATRYGYAIVDAGAAGGQSSQPALGSADAEFATFASGPQPLVVALGACARNESNGAVYDAIMAEEPDLYLALGDLHYSNLSSTKPGDHVAAWGRSLSQPGQAQLFSTVPSAYVWDDHDYGPNDGDSSSPARSAVSEAYRSAVPNYGVDPAIDAPIAQAFSIGRVRVIMTDTRSQRTDATMLGEAQLAWFLDDIVASSQTHAVVVWANPTPWIGPATQGGDTWASYAEERRTIANTLADARVQNLVMVSGDAHMVAIDNGDNSDYSDNGGGGFPVLHGAALDRPGSAKGGPYSEGVIPGSGQFATLRIDDDGGDRVELGLDGRSWNGEVLVSLSVVFDASHVE